MAESKDVPVPSPEVKKDANEEEKKKMQEDMRKLIEQNNEYENQIKSEIAKGKPMSSKSTFEPLLAEYANNKYFKALLVLTKSFTFIRHARRDGNCFYRSYLIQLLEFLNPQKAAVAGPTIEEKLRRTKDFLLTAGYDALVFDDSYDLMLREIDRLKKCEPGKFEETLIEVVSHPDTSNYLLLFLRLITSAYIKVHSEDFAGFVTEGSIEEYCRAEVEHFDHDCDHLQILALTSYVGAGIKVYVPREDGTIETMIFPESAKDYPISMLYLPGHYDPIYPSS